MKKIIPIAFAWLVIIEQTITKPIPCPGQDVNKQPTYTLCGQTETQSIKSEWKDQQTAKEVSDLLAKFKIPSRIEKKK